MKAFMPLIFVVFYYREMVSRGAYVIIKKSVYSKLKVHEKIPLAPFKGGFGSIWLCCLILGNVIGLTKRTVKNVYVNPNETNSPLPRGLGGFHYVTIKKSVYSKLEVHEKIPLAPFKKGDLLKLGFAAEFR